MSADPLTSAKHVPASVAPRFDRKFIVEHQLIERYLDGRLPAKGARDVEDWCRNNPEFLNELNLPGRAQSSLKLLEACGRPVDLSGPRSPWWQSVYLLIGLAVAAVASMTAVWILSGKNSILLRRLEEAHTLQAQGPLVQPASATSLTVTPDRAADSGRMHITVDRNVPQLIDVHVDLGFTEANANAGKKVTTFRLVVDKKDQGRTLIVNDLLKDSNKQLRLTFNTTGLSAGIYTARIEGVPFGGSAYPVGWLNLEVK